MGDRRRKMRDGRREEGVVWLDKTKPSSSGRKRGKGGWGRGGGGEGETIRVGLKWYVRFREI